ncbi:amidase domain-containing protein [Paenibacillus sp. FJAT-27812]|uniref:amidase domain-containing protein n=1 Tax=Paenibacillus sp. FJAT-27812 TaxID=1684143 RepID=UPI0006A77E8B|nr:amidase domain-containing protein [Paenibacillus sp. FJAT-27812]
MWDYILFQMRFFTSFTLSLVLVATLVTPIFADESVKTPEKIIIEHLKQQGKNYTVGSADYNMYIHNIPWNVDTSLSKLPEYDQLVIYAINYGKENLDKQIVQKDTKANQDKTVLSVQNVLPRASTALSYNRQQVVNYAYNWTTNGGTKRNTAFDNYTNDCTNFGSQAWNGGGNVMRSQSTVPSGITQSTSYWYSFKRGTSFDVSTSWIRVVEFYGY